MFDLIYSLMTHGFSFLAGMVAGAILLAIFT